MFSTSRILYNLSRKDQASARFGKLNQNFVPANSLFISTLVISAGALLSKLVPEQAFGIVTTVSAICFIWVWGVVLVCHIKYKKNRPDLQAASKFKAPFTPAVNYIVLALFAAILIIMLIAEETRPALLFTPVWFILLFILYSVRSRKQKSSQEISIKTEAGNQV
ncbi:D-serine/D-alanine/glycine transporter [compost metagenome]